VDNNNLNDAESLSLGNNRVMYKALHHYISSKVSVTEKELEIVSEHFAPRKLRKRQYLLQEGQICRYSAFVVKGVLRQYMVDDKGIEHITQFAIEDWWISDRESFANQTPSMYNIDALEDSELMLSTKEGMNELEKKIPAFKDLMIAIKERRTFAGQKRVVSALSYSAEQRYQHFIDAYPQIVQRVPQHMIASYLGITPETLSRLRAKTAKG
jgi:CRP-like cAMP-binding protein